MAELFDSKTGVADASGKAILDLVPLRSFEKWIITRMTIHSTSTTLVPTCKVYRGSETPSRMVDNSASGSLDHSDTHLQLNTGEHLIVVFEGADVGSQCTIVIEGTTEGR